MTTLTKIGVRTSFVAYHCWEAAPDEVSFLRDFHRHTFNVLVEIPVEHNDRDLEFFMVRKEIDHFIVEALANKYLRMSCEEMAKEIGHCVLLTYPILLCCTVRVQEDDENYGEVYCVND